MNAYAHGEYLVMWWLFTVVGMVGFAFNLFMIATWAVAGKKYFRAVPLQLKCCVGFGVLYGMVETLPVLILRYDLPCTCGTEEWSVLCVVFVSFYDFDAHEQ